MYYTCGACGQEVVDTYKNSVAHEQLECPGSVPEPEPGDDEQDNYDDYDNPGGWL